MMQERRVREGALEDTATRSSILAWSIPWTKEAGGGYSPRARRQSDTTEHTHVHRLWMRQQRTKFFPTLFPAASLSRGSFSHPQGLPAEAGCAGPELALWSGSVGARGAGAASPGGFICQGDGRHQASRKQLSAPLSMTQPRRRLGPRPLPPSVTAPAPLPLRGASKCVMPAAGPARHTSQPERPTYSQVGKTTAATQVLSGQKHRPPRKGEKSRR